MHLSYQEPVTLEDAMTPPRDGLLQMIQQNDDKHEEAHRRLRQDVDKLEEQVNKGFESLRDRIITVEKTPIDATKLVLSTRVIVTLVIIALSIAAAVWSIRSGVEKLADKMESVAKLQDVQNSALKTSVDEMRRRQELQQYEISDLKEAILTGKTKPRQQQQ